MTIDSLHIAMAITFFALWAMVGQIAVASRRTEQDRRESKWPVSGNVWQR